MSSLLMETNDRFIYVIFSWSELVCWGRTQHPGLRIIDTECSTAP